MHSHSVHRNCQSHMQVQHGLHLSLRTVPTMASGKRIGQRLHDFPHHAKFLFCSVLRFQRR